MKRTQNNIFSTHNLVMMAALAAMQIILARFFGIQASDTLRISFESIPVILAGLWLGPVPGMLVGLVADTLGTLMQGLVWFPPLALNPVMEGLVAGLSAKYFIRDGLTTGQNDWKVALTALTTGLLNAFVVGLVGSTLYSIIIKGNTTAFSALLWTNLLTRLTTKPWTIAANVAIVVMVNRAVYRSVVAKIVRRTA